MGCIRDFAVMTPYENDEMGRETQRLTQNLLPLAHLLSSRNILIALHRNVKDNYTPTQCTYTFSSRHSRTHTGTHTISLQRR